MATCVDLFPQQSLHIDHWLSRNSSRILEHFSDDVLCDYTLRNAVQAVFSAARLQTIITALICNSQRGRRCQYSQTALNCSLEFFILLSNRFTMLVWTKAT